MPRARSRRFVGNYDDNTLLSERDELLKTRWPHPNGERLRVEAASLIILTASTSKKSLLFKGPAPQDEFGRSKRAGTRPAFQVSKSKIKHARFAIVGVNGIKGVIFDRQGRQ